MKAEWNSYLQDIGFTQPFLDRTNLIYGFINKIQSEDILDIFVSEYVDKEKKRVYENLWLFSEKTCFEAKSFIAKLDIDATPIKDDVSYWNFEAENYDFENQKEDSRLTLHCSIRDSTTSAEFKASNNNCNYLMSIFSKHISPNLK